MTIEEFYDFKERLSKELTVFYGRVVSERNVLTALYVLYADIAGMGWSGDVLKLEISYDEMLCSLRQFDFSVLEQTIEIDDACIPAQFILNGRVRVKHNGSVWIIHKNDLDPFPSSPHAHSADLNHKLDLSNGNCYRKRELIFTIPKKEFMAIRKKAAVVYKGDLPRLAI